MKDILWIDDMDDKNSESADIEEDEPSEPQKEKWIRDSLAENSVDYTASINLLDKMPDAFKEIADNFNHYNLVIFDMNMEKGWNTTEERESLGKEFEKYHINVNFKVDTTTNKCPNDKIAGIYLYLLLLTKGYPADRMIIYTGNSYEKLETDFSYLNLNGIIKKKDEDKLDLGQFYPQDNYYRIRRLVQQGCHYWREKIEEKNDPQDIVFNRIYFKTENQISVENFRELLDRIEMMFPVVPPANPKQLYYQVARILCEYHEEKAKIQKIANKAYYPFHVVCRNFRNWSSHNKFESVEMSASIFALIFCIVLRTYFDDKQSPEEQKEFFSECYEDIYFSKKDTSYKDIDEKTLNRLYGNISNWLYEKISIFQIFDEYKKNKKSLTYSNLTYILGLGDTPREIYEILFPILMGNKKVPLNLEFFDSVLSKFKKADTNSSSDNENNDTDKTPSIFTDTNFSSNNENNDTDTNSSFNNDFVKLMLNKACKILKVEFLQEKSED